MNEEGPRKVAARHLQRQAYLYVRQSTLRQVLENTESTQRQYALRQRAMSLGWTADQIVVIDRDQGQSGASAADREGFQHLVTEVGLGRAGLVMGLEVSRLARNSSDWHRLLEICALSDTLILDEDGIYDPAHFNDRLLLGLKGTMSEAELHVLKARLQGGILSKARRGELQGPLPIGLVYDARGHVVLDPDRQIQDAVRFLFETFRRTGSACATVKVFREQGMRFPRRARGAPRKGDVVWDDLEHSRTLFILHNPRYAGAFFYGRSRQRKHVVAGQKYHKLPQDEWIALVKDAHPGYISWEEYEQNERILRQNAHSQSDDRRQSPPREGAALLQGLVICGRCGRRMTVRYHQRHGALVPDYYCQREQIAKGGPTCQVIPGAGVDAALEEAILAAFNPLALEVALAVDQELQARVSEVERLRYQQVERARYEAELARRRYLQVDPEHRLVAASLEAAWNDTLRTLEAAQHEYEQQRQADRRLLGDEQRAQILALTTDFPRLWRDPTTPMRDRKRLIRLLIEDVTLLKVQDVTAHLRFRGGATQTLELARARCAWELRQTPRAVIARIDELLNEHTDAEIAAILERDAYRSGMGRHFNGKLVGVLRRQYRLRSRYDRLRAQGLLTQQEIASVLGVHEDTVKNWRAWGLLRAHTYTDRPDYLYEPPGGDAPRKFKWKRRAVATGSLQS